MSIRGKGFRTAIVALVFALALLAGLMLGMAGQARASGEPPSGTVAGIQTRLFYPRTVTSGSTDYYLTASGLANQVQYWHAADVFVKSSDTIASNITVTVQLSPDGTNFADAVRDEVLNNVVTVTPYRIVFTAGSDQVKTVHVPLAGEYIRFKVEHGETFTPTLWLSLRND